MSRSADRGATRRRITLVAALGLVVSAFGVPSGTLATAAVIEGSPPGFSKAFSPSTIGPDSTATLTFTIDNGDNLAPAENLAFSDTLPAGMTIAAPASAATTCAASGAVGPVVSAPDGSTTISLSDASVAAGAACTVSVNVTAPAIDASPTVYDNVSSPLTSSFGISDNAGASLTVETDRPGFTKSFSPSTINRGERSTLTFEIDNSLNPNAATVLDFTDQLPPGMVIADPANAETSCGTATIPPELSAAAGSSVVDLFAQGTLAFPAVAAGSSCYVWVDVIGESGGALANVSGQLLATVSAVERSGGVATDTLDALVSQLHIAKDFTDDPIPPSGVGTLEITIANGDRVDATLDVAFTDTLPRGVTLATPADAVSDCGGALTADDGGAAVSLAGGTIAAEAGCTITVSVTADVSGSYTNTTSGVTGTIGGNPVEGNSATETLYVVPAPILTKQFTDDPVAAGGTTTLEFTITNTATSPATDISFVDELTDNTGSLGTIGSGNGFLPFPVSVTLPPLPDPPCGPSSSLALISLGTDRQGLELTGGSLDGLGDSCTFSVTLDIPVGFPGGTYTNTTEPISATVDTCGECFETVTGSSATDDLVVVGAPQLTKQFLDDPVAPGGTTTLEFTLVHDEFAAGDATDITFTDDLTFASGVTAMLPPLPDSPCGAGSSLVGSAGDPLLTLVAGTLAPGESCTFSVPLAVDAAAPSGTFTNTTSDVSATVLGVATTGLPAADDLLITGLILTKQFVDDPVIAGGTTTLRFTLDNTNGVSDATGIFFTDDLDAELPGLTAALPPVPDPPCGAGSSLVDSGVLVLIDGNVAAGSSCSFDLIVTVPAGTPDGSYRNSTSSVTAQIGGATVVLPPAVDLLVVDSGLLALTKQFTDDPVAPGGTVTLEFVVTNLSAVDTITGISFQDDLNAALAGMVATAGLFNDCGGMAAFPVSVFDFPGDSLPPGGSCTIRLAVQVPPGPLPGNVFTNTTTAITGKVGELDVAGDPAGDDLQIQTVEFAKSFGGPAAAGGTAVLTFTIDNLDSLDAVEALAFADDLDAVLTGLTATSLPVSPCGAGSAVSGTGVLTLTGGSVPPAGSCSFDVEVAVPADAAAGTYPNTTSDLFASGLPVADPATADLTIEPPPTFAKAFSPDSVPLTTDSTLTFTIDNTASALTAGSLDFTDTLPAGIEIATPPNASTTCTGGTLTAAGGDTVIGYSGGTLIAGASCTVQVDVTATAEGTLVNTTGELTSSSGNSGTASDTLTVTAAEVDVSVTKTDGLTTAIPGFDLIEYTIVVANAGPSTASAVTLTDVFDPALDCFDGSSTATGGATGNSPTYDAGSDLAETLAMPAGSGVTYTILCGFEGPASGTLLNTATADVDDGTIDTNPENNSATDETVLTPQADISVTKTDGVTSAVPGKDTIEYTITVTNPGPSAAPAVSLTDVMPAALTCTWTSTATGGASGNTASGSGDIAETLAMPPGSSATYTTDCAIDPAATGTLSNTATASFASVGDVPQGLTEAVADSVSDPNASNNSATDSDTRLTPEVDISVTKTDGVTAATSGTDSLRYTIVVRNSGPSTDPAVRLTDQFDGRLTCSWTSTAAGGATGNSATGSGDISETLAMPAGSTVTYQATCSILPAASGALSNTATATASVTDTDGTNNSATDSNTTLTAQAPTSTIPATGGDASTLVHRALSLIVTGFVLLGLSLLARRRQLAR